jgi:hypothetical protein
VYPVDLTLSQLDFGPGWVKGRQASLADTIAIWDPTLTIWNIYYQSTDSSWHQDDAASTAQDNLVIPAGTVIGILKKAPLNGAASFLASPLPYSLR